jgi:3',5'-cyclic AMP phosphodiesterase CpdA
VVAAFSLYRRQIVSWATHWKGSPSHSVPYVPHSVEEPPRLRLAAAGDVGDPSGRLRSTGVAVGKLTQPVPYAALLLLGDNVYPAGDPAELPRTVFEPFAAALEGGARLLAILGNHDVKGGHGDEQLAALGMEGPWWAWEKNGVLVIGLDSNQPDNPQQRAWLTETLQASTAVWKIVAVHHPPYSAGYQGSNLAVRRAFAPIFERHGVQLVLSGHDHDYQRSKAINGVTYVVSGAAADTRRTGERSFTAVSFSWHHFVDIAVFSDRLVGRCVNQDGRVADEFVLTQRSSRSPSG